MRSPPESTDTFFCDRFSYGHEIYDEERDNADVNFQLDSDAAEFATDKILMQREVAFAAGFFTTSVWGTDKAGGTDFTKWSDYASFSTMSFKAFGLAAFLILLLLAATSHDYWLAFLTPPVWKAMHMLVYLAFGLAVGGLAGAVAECRPLVSSVRLRERRMLRQFSIDMGTTTSGSMPTSWMTRSLGV